MAPKPIVTGLSPKEGPPGTKITIRGEFLGSRASDLISLKICGTDCLLSAEWKSPNKIIARTGPAKGKGDIIVTTASGGVGSSTVQFRAYYETIGPMKESAVWIEESPMQSLAWGRRSHAPTKYTQEDPLGLSIEGNVKKMTEDLRDIFPDGSGDLSQENFAPGWFLLEHHNTTSFDDLKAGLLYLRRKVETQRDGQLSFLKANTGPVMDQLDTLMMLRDKFEDDVDEVGAEPIKKLESAIKDSIIEANSLFTDVLFRREKADTMRVALFALSRHRFLFCLPKSVEQNAQRKEYDIVINDYARAKNLFGKTEIPIFRLVLDQVDERILQIRKDLHAQVCHMPQSIEQQKKLVKALTSLELQQNGLPIAQQISSVDSAWDAIDARAKYLDETMKTIYEQYVSKEAAPPPPSSSSSASKSREPLDPPSRVLFCEEICEIASSNLTDCWRLGQLYFSGELRGLNEPKPGNFKRIIITSIEAFCSYLRSAIFSAAGERTANMATNPTWPAQTSSSIYQFTQWLPQCLRYIRIAYATLIRVDLPSEVLDIIQKLINQLRLLCLSTLFVKTIEKVKQLDSRETWKLAIADFPGATELPLLFEELVIELLEEGVSTCYKPEMREGPLLEDHSDASRDISQRTRELMTTFTEVIEVLAFQRYDSNQQTPLVSQLIGFVANASAVNPMQPATPDEKGNTPITSWDQRLLCCLANCLYCNKIFFNRLATIFSKYGYPISKLVFEEGRITINKLLNSIVDTYVENKSDPLVGTVEPSMYIGRFQWDLVTKADDLRPYAHECCDNLIGVYSEIYAISPLLLRPILEPIIQMVAEELARLMSCVQRFSANGALQANVDIRFIRDSFKLYSNVTARTFFGEALDAIPQLSEEGERHVQTLLAKTKQKMKLHSICFSVHNP